MMLMKKAISRRTVFRGVGAAIALPLLDAMVPALTAAQNTPARPVRRLGVVYHPNGVVYENWLERTMIPPLKVQASAVGLDITRLPVRAAADLDEAFQQAVKERVGAVMPVASARFHAEKSKLVQLAARHQLPAMYENHVFPETGGLMSYGPDVQEIFRRAAAHVDRILRGARPADLPVEQPTKFHFVVNLDTARALGLTLPAPLLLRADRVIDGRR